MCNEQGSDPIDPTIKTVPPLLATQLRWILWLYGIAVGIVLVRGNLFRESYPYNTFLFLPTARFNDFTNCQPRFNYFGTTQFYAHSGFPHAEVPFVYLPISSVLGQIVFRSLIGYLAVLLLLAIVLAVCFAKGLRSAGLDKSSAIACAFIAVASSYPLMFLLDRANIEGVTWIFTTVALLSCFWRRWWIAATFIALAAAMKIFPAALFALLLSKKKWPQLTYGIFLTILLTVLSLWLIGPTIEFAWHGSMEMLQLLVPMYVIPYRPFEWPFVHSLFSIIKQGLYLLDAGPSTTLLIFKGYNLLTPALGLLLYFFGLRKQPLLNQAIALTACSVFLPWWSADYTLVHMYVPWGLLMVWIVTQWRSGIGVDKRLSYWFLIPFAILFTPQSYLIPKLDLGIGGQVKAVALLVIIIGCLKIPLRLERWEGEEA